MTISERISNALSLLITEGAIFYIHYSILNFGNSEKPMHYAISQSSLMAGASKAFFNPCTSKYQDNHKDVFTFNLSKKIGLDEGIKTYVLLSLSKYVKLVDFTKKGYCIYKGTMDNSTLEKYRRAKKDYISGNYSKGNYF
jgi:hypothetical protein